MMSTFRKKPVEVDAWQFTPEACATVPAWVRARWEKGRMVDGAFHGSKDGEDLLFIDTLEGTMSARVNDWIIKGVKGELYPCKPDIFEATYDPVTDRTAPAKEASAEGEARSEPLVTDESLDAFARDYETRFRLEGFPRLREIATCFRELQSHRSSPVREGDRGLPDLSPSDIAPSAGWMPIETAPRSRGSHLLLFGSGAGFALCAVVGALDHDGYWRALWNREAFEPTHWMRLPDSPLPLPSAPVGSAPPSDEGGSRPPSSSDRDAVIEEMVVEIERYNEGLVPELKCVIGWLVPHLRSLKAGGTHEG